MLPQGLKCNSMSYLGRSSAVTTTNISGASSTYCSGEFTSQQSHWWTGLEHTLHKNFLMIGQPVIEAIMSRELGDLVSYSRQVASIAEDCEGVVLEGRELRHVVPELGGRC
jgi:hypothetical protein